jgi:hypothetical protein
MGPVLECCEDADGFILCILTPCHSDGNECESTIANARVETSRFNSIHFTTSLE